MKNLILIGALLAGTSAIYAQSNDKPVTVRIKKVEKINGVEKITDTTYTINDASTLTLKEESMGIINWTEESDSGKKIIRIQESVDSPEIIIDNEMGGALETLTISSIDEASGKQTVKKIILNDPSGKMNKQDIQRDLDIQMKDLDREMKKIDHQLQNMILVDTESEKKDGEKQTKTTKIFILKNVRISEPNKEDEKMLNKQTGISDKKLLVEDMHFYPNPSDGKFNLDFQISTKGNTEVSILNMEGKSIYVETLKDFRGNYSKALDISSQPKGIYFLKIKQGEHAQVKKIILE